MVPFELVVICFDMYVHQEMIVIIIAIHFNYRVRGLFLSEIESTPHLNFHDLLDNEDLKVSV